MLRAIDTPAMREAQGHTLENTFRSDQPAHIPSMRARSTAPTAAFLAIAMGPEGNEQLGVGAKRNPHRLDRTHLREQLGVLLLGRPK